MVLHNFLLSIDLESSIMFILVHRYRLSINLYRGQPTGLPPGSLPVRTRCSIPLFRYICPINVICLSIIDCISCPGLYKDLLHTSSLVTCSFQLIFSIRGMNHVSKLINRFSSFGHIVNVSHPYSRMDHTYARSILSLVFSEMFRD